MPKKNNSSSSLQNCMSTTDDPLYLSQDPTEASGGGLVDLREVHLLLTT